MTTKYEEKIVVNSLKAKEVILETLQENGVHAWLSQAFDGHTIITFFASDANKVLEVLKKCFPTFYKYEWFTIWPKNDGTCILGTKF